MLRPEILRRFYALLFTPQNLAHPSWIGSIFPEEPGVHLKQTRLSATSFRNLPHLHSASIQIREIFSHRLIPLALLNEFEMDSLSLLLGGIDQFQSICNIIDSRRLSQVKSLFDEREWQSIMVAAPLLGIPYSTHSEPALWEREADPSHVLKHRGNELLRSVCYGSAPIHAYLALRFPLEVKGLIPSPPPSCIAMEGFILRTMKQWRPEWMKQFYF